MATNLDLAIPFNGQILSNAQYQQMAAAYRQDGILSSLGATPLQVVQRAAGANMSVDVSAGRIVIQGTHGENSSVKNLAITSNSSGNPRIDTVVARLVQATPFIVLDVLQGTPAGVPVAPTLTRNASIWEVPLANVAVASGAASIVTANITERRGWSTAGGSAYRPQGTFASASTVSIPFSTDPTDIAIVVTGTTTITNIPIGPAGTILRLVFANAGCNVTNAGVFVLNSGYTSVGVGILTLISDGTSWVEIGRNPPLLTVAANAVAVGPASGANAQSTYRSLVAKDLPGFITVSHANASTANPTTTSTTLVTIPEMSIAVPLVIGDIILAFFQGSFSHASASVGVQVAIQSDVGTINTTLMRMAAPAAGYAEPITVFGYLVAASTATHTITAKWLVDSGTGSCYGLQRSLYVVKIDRTSVV